MGKRYLGVEIGEDGYVVETPDNKRRPKTSPTNGRLKDMPATKQYALPDGFAYRVADKMSPMPLALWRMILS